MPEDVLRFPEATTVKGTALAHVDFVLSGIVMTLLGPLLPMLSGRWALNDMQAGYLFTAQYIASIGGMLLSTVMLARRGYRITMITGLVLMAVGIAVLAQASKALGFTSIGIFGVGFGLTTPAVNLFVAHSHPTRSASALNLVNSSWGVGAMGAPLLIAIAERFHKLPGFLYGLAVVLALLAVVLTRVLFAVDSVTRKIEGGTAAPKPRPKLLWLLIVPVMFFIYVGTENAVGGWVAAYARRMEADSRTFWTVVPAFFWGALLFGRALAPLILRRMRETRLAASGVALAALGVIVLLAAKTTGWVAWGATMAGMGLSSVYPIKISLLPRWFGGLADRMGGVVFSLGNLGGATLPWVVGLVSTRYGSLRAGFLVPLLGTLVMLIFYLANFFPRHNPA